MHSYLRAIGFSKYKSRRQLEPVYKSCLREPSRKEVTTISVDTSMLQFEKDFDKNLGISLVGEVDAAGACSIEHYFPYYKGRYFMEFEGISIEKQTDKESYAGVCEDLRLGMTIIFYVVNIADYAKSKWFNYSNRGMTRVKLSGLSTEGTVLLGTKKPSGRNAGPDLSAPFFAPPGMGDLEDPHEYHDPINHEYGRYELLTTRACREDLLTIVETSFMPCGVECDHYLVVGNILEVREMKNSFTEEKIYNLLIEANYLTIDVVINQEDLMGEPEVGRRFRGEIWLQGVVQI